MVRTVYYSTWQLSVHVAEVWGQWGTESTGYNACGGADGAGAVQGVQGRCRLPAPSAPPRASYPVQEVQGVQAHLSSVVQRKLLSASSSTAHQCKLINETQTTYSNNNQGVPRVADPLFVDRFSYQYFLDPYNLTFSPHLRIIL